MIMVWFIFWLIMTVIVFKKALKLEAFSIALSDEHPDKPATIIMIYVVSFFVWPWIVIHSIASWINSWLKTGKCE